MRYAVNNTIDISQYLDYDVVIVGSGLAGLYTALHIDREYSCCLLTKESVDISNSWLAQGGIAAAISRDDTPLLHLKDTLIAGAGLCDREAVAVLADEGPQDIAKLVSMNVPFDLDAEGDLKITREGGHRKNRVVHAGGDATGRETVMALAYLVAHGSGVKFMRKTFFVDILTDGSGAVCGVLINNENGYSVIRSKNVVIATGGIGQVYRTTTNPAVATGDGIAAAMRAGASVKNLEFIQFHPTGLWSPKPEDRAFLISEAVRGEGAVLRNKDGVRFMETAHELKDLAPRDIVARACAREMENGGEDHVYLDARGLSDEFLSGRFPTIYNECKKRGILMSRDLIPVCPVQHYLNGGIKTDLHAGTNVPGLYICGEAAATGVHGANRLASNSMLECLIFGRRAAESINPGLKNTGSQTSISVDFPERKQINFDCAAIRKRIQGLMNDYGGVVRNKAGLEKAFGEISELLESLESGFDDSRDYIEVLNIATIAKAILEAALARTESVGTHWRED